MGTIEMRLFSASVWIVAVFHHLQINETGQQQEQQHQHEAYAQHQPQPEIIDFALAILEFDADDFIAYRS